MILSFKLNHIQAELEKWYSNVEKSSAAYEKKMKEKEDWQKYLSCNPKPDVFQEAEVTTYLTQYTETNRIKTLSIQGVIEDFQYTEGVFSSC